MYASQVNDQTLTFVVSGKLWNRSLVMKDQETGGLWSHILGKCMEGKLRGTILETFPAAMTDWGTWKTQHPESSVLKMSRTSRNYQRDFYQDPTKFVLGVKDGGSSKAYSFEILKASPVVNDTFKGEPIAVIFNEVDCSGYIYERRVNERTLTLRKIGDVVTDKETGTTWNMHTGEAIEGELKGEKLRPLTAIPSYKRAWDAFHPDAEYYKP